MSDHFSTIRDAILGFDHALKERRIDARLTIALSERDWLSFQHDVSRMLHPSPSPSDAALPVDCCTLLGHTVKKAAQGAKP